MAPFNRIDLNLSFMLSIIFSRSLGAPVIHRFRLEMDLFLCSFLFFGLCRRHFRLLAGYVGAVFAIYWLYLCIGTRAFLCLSILLDALVFSVEVSLAGWLSIANQLSCSVFWL